MLLILTRDEKEILHEGSEMELNICDITNAKC